MPERYSLAILTTGRQDYGILRSSIHLLLAERRLEARVWVGGMHLSERFGRTIDHVRADGVPVHRELEFVHEPPDPAADASRALLATARAIAAEPIDAMLLMGDRLETLAAGVAATVAGVPIIHLHGGEESEGAIDNACRHALTKLSHLHLVSHELHARRVRQMGEDPATVVVVGPPGLDNAVRQDLPDRAQLGRTLGLDLRDPVVLVTLHPVTIGGESKREVEELAAAIERVPATYIITQPNSDAGGADIAAFWTRWSAGRDNARVVRALGETAYWGLLRVAAAVIGNSSSGIIEAPAADVPVVNVGDRQLGRMRWGRVADVPASSGDIEAALKAAIARTTPTMPGGYPIPPAAPRVLAAILAWLPERRARKHFHPVS